ncbi:uncharacterized protein LOC116209156 [Punica granatum]|uniref:Uncharacterized protein LOC116209156 n=2 Tax=Punica granatum TaxID=22663 RepID=A0A6P8DZE8_PUNGR|nr:uncharacterized protein LOC116209156 [Punica granatum]
MHLSSGFSVVQLPHRRGASQGLFVCRTDRPSSRPNSEHRLFGPSKSATWGLSFVQSERPNSFDETTALIWKSSLLFLARRQSPPLLLVIMTKSKRLAERKISRFEKNITKRGSVPETTTKKGNDYPVGPILLGFFIFVVVGSSLFQIIRTAMSRGMV